ncbi:hypothetical protein ACQ4LE_009340 [Meloidogyne hapla]
MSRFFIVLVIVATVFIHCCDAGKDARKTQKKQKNSTPKSSLDNPANDNDAILDEMLAAAQRENAEKLANRNYRNTDRPDVEWQDHKLAHYTFYNQQNGRS